jgi:hypothetical protein
MDARHRWLDRQQTADYLSVRIDRLPRLVREGKIPKPNYTLGQKSPRWDLLAIDAVFNGPAVRGDVDQMVKEHADNIRERAARRARRALLKG